MIKCNTDHLYPPWCRDHPTLVSLVWLYTQSHWWQIHPCLRWLLSNTIAKIFKEYLRSIRKGIWLFKYCWIIAKHKYFITEASNTSFYLNTFKSKHFCIWPHACFYMKRTSSKQWIGVPGHFSHETLSRKEPVAIIKRHLKKQPFSYQLHQATSFLLLFSNKCIIWQVSYCVRREKFTFKILHSKEKPSLVWKVQRNSIF